MQCSCQVLDRRAFPAVAKNPKAENCLPRADFSFCRTIPAVRCPLCASQLNPRKSVDLKRPTGPVTYRYYECLPNESHPEKTWRGATVERVEKGQTVYIGRIVVVHGSSNEKRTFARR
jgi:hypothetical protein